MSLLFGRKAAPRDPSAGTGSFKASWSRCSKSVNDSELPRVIVHLDADAFFASVEQAADSHLRGKPVAVGGEKRGIIASAAYEGRRFGVYTPMPTVRARKL